MSSTRTQNQTPFGAKITVLDNIVKGKELSLENMVNNIVISAYAKGEAITANIRQNGQAVINSHTNSTVLEEVSQDYKNLGYHLKYEA